MLSDTLDKNFIEFAKNYFKEDFEAFIDALNSDVSYSIRINPSKWKEKVNLEPVKWSEYGFYLKERPIFTLDPLFHSGAYYVQEASSMFIEYGLKQIIDFNESIKALDLCAAPGGKSTHLLSLINDKSLLVSNEVIKTRTNILVENLIKWGYSNLIITQNDPNMFGKINDYFDLMLIDAPCSGEGMFRKDKSSVNEWSLENVAMCANRQKRILADSINCLKEQGILIYSTCTYNESENEDVINWLLNEYDFESIELELQDENIIVSKKDKAIFYRFFPHKVKGEGYSVTFLRKKYRSSNKIEYTKIMKGPNSSNDLKTITKLKKLEILDEKFDFEIEKIDNELILIGNNFNEEIKFLKRKLNIRDYGLNLGKDFNGRIKYSNNLAMSNLLNKSKFEHLELSIEDTIRFLRKDNFNIQSEIKGEVLITFREIAIGWINNLGNRYNNLYPKDWRILKDFDLNLAKSIL